MSSSAIPSSNEPDRADWLAGYSAAIIDAVSLVDALGGASLHNLSAPVLMRIKARLIELQARQSSRAA